MKQDDKVELINYLAFLHNKMTRLSIRLFVQGEDTTEIDKARNRLNKEIDKLRTDIAKQWRGRAENVMGDLRKLNNRAQTIIRDLDQAADKAQKVTKVLSLFDKGLNLVKGLIV
jgi:predicted  nucleic acid-binding Zn-ribbon protein